MCGEGYLVDSKERRLPHLDKLFWDLNAISVVAFFPLFIYVAVAVVAALDGRPVKLLYALPWLALMVAYWYWRYNHLSVRCRDYVRAKNVSEYERTIKWDSVRTVVLGAAVITTVFYILFEVESVTLFPGLFVGGLFLYSMVVGLTTLSYWMSAWLDSRRAGD